MIFGRKRKPRQHRWRLHIVAISRKLARDWSAEVCVHCQWADCAARALFTTSASLPMDPAIAARRCGIAHLPCGPGRHTEVVPAPKPEGDGREVAPTHSTDWHLPSG